MQIDWAALGQVFGVTLVMTVTMVGVFTLGILGTSARKARPEGADGGAVATSGVASALARTGGYACYALCAAAVAYGIYLIVSG
ncbi:hypothetical protein [Streptomyces sp. SAJ15]|uniref:hypothetical protein n=1 Tax=Streptomyces sp. SAJ15 TaxID=2011095 RepID=UPI0011856860|nr:hypothetical protein [Streptomyces sp. SAJ15]TVL90740.1 hypothetical protein CD790_19305 [Streptomyces sp. SAJ15]